MDNTEIENQQKIWDNIAPEWHKHKRIPSQLSEEFLKKCHGKVLDLGSGSGRHLTKIKDGKMYLVDFSRKMLKLAEQKAKSKKIDAEFIKTNLFNLPFKNSFFDFAISISSIHCLNPKNARKAVKELYRVLKPKAKVLIGVWNFMSKRFNQKNSKERLIGWTNKGKRYYYLFEEREIHDLFKNAGFEIISTHNSEMMINFIAQK